MVRGLTATAANHYFTLVHDLPSSSHRSGSLQDSTGFLLLDAVLCNIFLSLLINLAPAYSIRTYAEHNCLAVPCVMCSGGTVESHMLYSIGIHATVGTVPMF